MPITPLEIRKQTFATQLRGFAPAEVKAFLALVANELEELRKERGSLVERVDELTARLETYEKTERLLHETLLTAQKATEDLRHSARQEAEGVLAEARAKGQEVVQQSARQRQELEAELRLLRIQRSNLIDEISGIAQSYLTMADRQRSGIRPNEHERAGTREHPGHTG